ncbi:hypothetical protein P4O66_003754 [Electrophorus voltai]|uniref:Uncharacterized protein n=1 Tax=Electrophorus voltai TaxID=2609070 RepID=A0AAD9E6K2_9TELE|nr:hypothetical protein P4O66_003754 [Electrophorus voltai]
MTVLRSRFTLTLGTPVMGGRGTLALCCGGAFPKQKRSRREALRSTHLGSGPGSDALTRPSEADVENVSAAGVTRDMDGLQWKPRDLTDRALKSCPDAAVFTVRLDYTLTLRVSCLVTSTAECCSESGRQYRPLLKQVIVCHDAGGEKLMVSVEEKRVSGLVAGVDGGFVSKQSPGNTVIHSTVVTGNTVIHSTLVTGNTVIHSTLVTGNKVIHSTLVTGNTNPSTLSASSGLAQISCNQPLAGPFCSSTLERLSAHRRTSLCSQDSEMSSITSYSSGVHCWLECQSFGVPFQLQKINRAGSPGPPPWLYQAPRGDKAGSPGPPPWLYQAPRGDKAGSPGPPPWLYQAPRGDKAGSPGPPPWLYQAPRGDKAGSPGPPPWLYQAPRGDKAGSPGPPPWLYQAPRGDKAGSPGPPPWLYQAPRGDKAGSPGPPPWLYQAPRGDKAGSPGPPPWLYQAPRGDKAGSPGPPPWLYQAPRGDKAGSPGPPPWLYQAPRGDKAGSPGPPPWLYQAQRGTPKSNSENQYAFRWPMPGEDQLISSHPDQTYQRGEEGMQLGKQAGDIFSSEGPQEVQLCTEDGGNGVINQHGPLRHPEPAAKATSWRAAIFRVAMLFKNEEQRSPTLPFKAELRAGSELLPSTRSPHGCRLCGAQAATFGLATRFFKKTF